MRSRGKTGASAAAADTQPAEGTTAESAGDDTAAGGESTDDLTGSTGGGDLAGQGDDQVQADDVTSPAIERMEATAEDEAFDDPYFAKGDLRDLILRLFRERPKPWSQMNEGDQRDTIAAVENVATTVVQKIAKAIAAEGRQEIAATLEKMVVKDGLQLTLKGPYSHDAMLMLGDAQGKQVLITMPRSDRFDNARGAAKYDPDQPAMFPENSSDLANADDDRMTVVRDENGQLSAIIFGERKVVREGAADGEGKLTVVHAESGEAIGEPTDDERTQFDFAADNPGVATAAAAAVITSRINLSSGMLQTLPEGADASDDAAWHDERQASPEELAAERDRLADFEA